MIYAFEEFELDSVQLELRQNGAFQKMEPQVYNLLELLISNAHRLITKDELIEKIWDGRFISEAAISSRIRSARIAVSDDGKQQRLIKTVHSRGFRFVGDVSVIDLRKPQADISAIDPASSNSPLTDDGYSASIAVLPFADMSAASDQKYLADGLAEELLNVLARVDGLKVTSRTSAFAFRGGDKAISEIGAALNVNHVLEGSVRQAGSTLRITSQLIDAKTDSHLWSQTYDRPLNAENILQVQDEIAQKIVAELMGKLKLPATVAAAPRIASVEAYEFYLRGKELMRESVPQSLKLAIDLYNQAIAIDPDYAPAFAGLAQAYNRSVIYAGLPIETAVEKMTVNVERGLELAPENPEVLTAAAMLAEREFALEKALILFDRATAIAPKYAAAHKGRADVLNKMGQHGAALSAYEEALVHDPVSPAILGNISDRKLALGDIDGALLTADINLKWNKDAAQALNMKALLERHRGNYDSTHQLLLDAAVINADEYYVQADLARLYLDIGLDDLALAAVRTPGTTAVIQAFIGNKDMAAALAGENSSNYDFAYAAYLTKDYHAAYAVTRNEVTAYDLSQQSDIGMDKLLKTTECAYVLRQMDDPDAGLLLEKVEQFIGGRPVSSFKIIEAILGGAALQMMQDDPDGALSWIDAALDVGHSFLRLTQQPVFAPLKEHKGYPARLKKMQTSAKQHRAAVEKRLNQH